MEVKNFSLPEKLAAPLKSPAIAQHVGKFLCLVLIGVTLFIAIPERQNTRYYHMIDTEDYQAFIWIKENVGKEYEKAILDPWKATPFAALTGKRVYSRIHAFPTEKDRQASLFLKGGCSDTAFLREKGISIIYTEEECRNPDLTEVRDNVFILKTAQDSTERKNRLSSLNIRYLNPAPRLFPDLASYIPFIALKTILC